MAIEKIIGIKEAFLKKFLEIEKNLSEHNLNAKKYKALKDKKICTMCQKRKAIKNHIRCNKCIDYRNKHKRRYKNTHK
jgi:phage regulator Rha-like protein